MPTTTTFEITPLAGRIAARIDLDLESTLADPDAPDALRAALAEHLVLVLPELDPTPVQHIELARIFGTPKPPESYNPEHPDHPEICVFDSDGGYKADKWHADLTWRPEVTLGAVLCMRHNPSVGGDTIWSNCQAAYDDLSNGMKQLLDGRRAWHDIGPDPDHGTEHPLIARHPQTGRHILFVNEIFTRRITNLPPAESQAILPFLIRHTSRPDYTYRHRWSDGDVVIWDNRATQHYALADYSERRVVHRVGLSGWIPTA